MVSRQSTIFSQHNLGDSMPVEKRNAYMRLKHRARNAKPISLLKVGVDTYPFGYQVLPQRPTSIYTRVARVDKHLHHQICGASSKLALCSKQRQFSSVLEKKNLNFLSRMWWTKTYYTCHARFADCKTCWGPRHVNTRSVPSSPSATSKSRVTARFQR